MLKQITLNSMEHPAAAFVETLADWNDLFSALGDLAGSASRGRNDELLVFAEMLSYCWTLEGWFRPDLIRACTAIDPDTNFEGEPVDSWHSLFVRDAHDLLRLLLRPDDRQQRDGYGNRPLLELLDERCAAAPRGVAASDMFSPEQFHRLAFESRREACEAFRDGTLPNTDVAGSTGRAAYTAARHQAIVDRLEESEDLAAWMNSLHRITRAGHVSSGGVRALRHLLQVHRDTRLASLKYQRIELFEKLLAQAAAVAASQLRVSVADLRAALDDDLTWTGWELQVRNSRMLKLRFQFSADERAEPTATESEPAADKHDKWDLLTIRNQLGGISRSTLRPLLNELFPELGTRTKATKLTDDQYLRLLERIVDSKMNSGTVHRARELRNAQLSRNKGA